MTSSAETGFVKLYFSHNELNVLVGVGVGVGVAVGTGFAAATTLTPLFQISFLPLFTQVYLNPATVELLPALVHAAPAFTAAVALSGVITTASTVIAARTLRICQE
jgi:hypothetical protein